MASSLSAAINLAEDGRSVIPIGKGKKPLVEWKRFQTEAATVEEIEQWWEQWPDANVGVVTGRVSELVVVDVDKDKETGVPPAQVRARYSWGDTPLVQTGGGGFHYWYQHPGFHVPNFVRNAPGLDLRGDGGYVIAPPSMHESGTLYEWLIEGDPAPLPAWVMALVKQPALIEADAELSIMAGVSEGQRNATAARLSGRFFGMGLARDETLALLTSWNVKNSPPLPEREIIRVMESIAKAELMKGGEVVQPANDEERRALLVELSEKFDIKIVDIVKVLGATPYFHVRVCGLSGYELTVRLDGFDSQQHWGKVIGLATSVLPKRIGPKSKVGWRVYANQMMSLAREIDPGEESTTQGELNSWFVAHLSDAHIGSDDEPPRFRGDPFVRGGELHINASAFARSVASTFDEKLSSKVTAQLLAAAGFVGVTLRLKMHDESRQQVRMWKVPRSFILHARDTTGVVIDGLTSPEDAQGARDGARGSKRGQSLV